MKQARDEAKALRERRMGAAVVARTLFSSRSVDSTGSSRTAADTSILLNRAGLLLPNRESFEEFMGSMEEVIDLGEAVYPDIFTADFVAKIRYRSRILNDVYAEFGLHRDCFGLGGAVAEHFLRRFRGDTDREVMSPHSRLEWDSYEELVRIPEVPGDVIIGNCSGSKLRCRPSQA